MDSRFYPRLAVPVLCTGAVFMFLAASVWSTGAPAGRTGAPGDQTCNASGCHDSFDLDSGPGSVAIVASSEYEPGVPLDITVRVQQVSQERFGFQITARDDNGQFAGEWSFPASVRFAPNQTGGGENEQYLTHNPAVFVDDESTWSFQWVPPANGAGTVTFYAAGNAANGNGSNQGDHIYTTSLAVSQATDTAVERAEIPDALEVTSVFPNPAVSHTTIRYELMRTATARLKVFDASGQLVRTVDGGNRPAGSHHLELSVEGLSGGVYLFRLETTAGAESGKLLVIR